VLSVVCAQLLPYAEDLEGLSGDLFETFLEPYFDGEFKPVSTYIPATSYTHSDSYAHAYIIFS
jgi:hypothetical protein